VALSNKMQDSILNKLSEELSALLSRQDMHLLTHVPSYRPKTTMNSSPPVPILVQPYYLNSNTAPLPSLQLITDLILLAIIPTARNIQEWPITFISPFHSIPGRPFPFVKVCHLLCMGRRCNLYK